MYVYIGGAKEKMVAREQLFVFIRGPERVRTPKQWTWAT